MNSQNKDKLDNLIQQYRSISAPTDFSIKAYNSQADRTIASWFSMPSLPVTASLLTVFLIAGVVIQQNLPKQAFDGYPDMGQLSSMNISLHHTDSDKMPGLTDLGQIPDLTSIHMEIKQQPNHKPENKIQQHQETKYFIHTFS